MSNKNKNFCKNCVRDGKKDEIEVGAMFVSSIGKASTMTDPSWFFDHPEVADSLCECLVMCATKCVEDGRDPMDWIADKLSSALIEMSNHYAARQLAKEMKEQNDKFTRELNRRDQNKRKGVEE